MTDFQYGDELEVFMNALSVNAKWQTFDTAQKEAMLDRAFFDISAYAVIIDVEFKMENEFCRRALFEQTAHIAAQYETDSSGKTILQESITGFGSRKYKDTTAEWLAPRAKSYLEQFIKPAEDSEQSPSAPEQDPSAPDDTPNTSVTENEKKIGPIRILR